jgi:hypothetical protein
VIDHLAERTTMMIPNKEKTTEKNHKTCNKRNTTEKTSKKKKKKTARGVPRTVSSYSSHPPKPATMSSKSLNTSRNVWRAGSIGRTRGGSGGLVLWMLTMRGGGVLGTGVVVGGVVRGAGGVRGKLLVGLGRVSGPSLWAMSTVLAVDLRTREMGVGDPIVVDSFIPSPAFAFSFSFLL